MMTSLLLLLSTWGAAAAGAPAPQPAAAAATSAAAPAAPAAAATTATAPAAATQAAAVPPELTAIAEKMRGISTLTARLHQEKELAALAEVVRNDGAFAFARPRQLVLDLDGPGGTELIINGDTMTMRYKALNRVETTQLSRDSRARAVAEHLFLLLEADPTALSDTYALTLLGTQPLKARLTPKAEALGRFIRDVEATFDGRGFVSELLITEANGDTTRWRFDNPEINKPVPAERFRAATR